MSRTKHSYLENFGIFDYLLSVLRFRKASKYIWKGATLLDVGCGFNGYLLQYFLKNLKYGVGIDISVNKEGNRDKVKLINCNLDAEKFPDLPPFDIVTCLAVVEHVVNPKNLIKNIYNSLKNNGLLILTAPSWKSKPLMEFCAFKLKVIDQASIAEHKRYFNREEIISLCSEARFSDIQHTYFQSGLNNLIVAKK